MRPCGLNCVPKDAYASNLIIPRFLCEYWADYCQMEPNRRDEAILRFLAEKDIALPPTPLYENLRLKGATFSHRTTRRRLKQLEEAGYVEKILDEKGYYQITEKGREWLEENTR